MPDGSFEKAWLALMNAGHHAEADIILKIQQDAGLELEPFFDPTDQYVPTGERTRAIYSLYEPVTHLRCKTALSAAHKKLNAPTTPPPTPSV